MLSILELVVIIFIALVVSLHGRSPKVQLRGTTIIGKRLRSSNLDFFGGIPFSEPPVASLRFSSPRPKFSLAPLQSFTAHNYGLQCLQPYSNADMSENCLTLNVFRPSGVNINSRLPVMVWIYGGGFYSGGSSLYDGAPFVKQSVIRGTPIIFVSMNYRLGPLGFPQGPEAMTRGSLNLGLQDQWVALEWVQNNIAFFGGDPSKVTVFGQSAGAVSTTYHYVNENFTNVARAAILQSGTASTFPVFDPYRATPSWMLFAKNTPSCATVPLTPNNTFSCLMSASSSDLLAGMNAAMAIELFPFRPVFDGPQGILRESPAKRLSGGAGRQVPFMAGTVLDEATVFTPQAFQDIDIATWLNANYTPSPSGPDSLRASLDNLISLYPNDPSVGSPFGTGNETFGTGPGYKRGAAILGDIFFQAPRRFWSQTTSAPSYSYIFTEPQPGGDPAAGVYHGSELPYLFGDLAKNGPPKAAQLSRVMLDYWISFAVSLTPNDGRGATRPLWGTYEETKGVLELNGDTIGLIPDEGRAISIDLIIRMSDMLSW